ncbi:hypothetical protein, partial [Bradyrhizobium sp.]|uniref:hypothetical protein n=1 Tax=Bradyrhizobium sp. TaxID=376 RepID=UPI0025C322C5
NPVMAFDVDKRGFDRVPNQGNCVQYDLHPFPLADRVDRGVIPRVARLARTKNSRGNTKVPQQLP